MPGEHAHEPAGRPAGEVLRYLAIIKAARDFGLDGEEIAIVAGRFRADEPRCDELAQALGDLVVARA